MKKLITFITGIVLAINSIILSGVNHTITYAASQADTIVNIATAEIGAGDAPNTYTYWYGTISGSYNYAWCHAFVSWCANQAGISSSVIPKTASCDNGMTAFKNQGRWQSSSYQGGSYTPQKGDIIYFNWDSTVNVNDAQHVGIVYATDSSKVYTIEGNTSSTVAKRSYSLGSQTILGYGVPNYGNSPTVTDKYFPACASSYTSIVEALQSIGVDSSYSYRSKIAAANGISNYSGSADQNVQLLNLLKAGQLTNPDYEEPVIPTASYFPACSSSYSSIVEALQSIGVDSSYSYRSKIATANAISNYSGSADQNVQLLNLLKAGLLINPDAPVVTTTTTSKTTTTTTTTTTTITKLTTTTTKPVTTTTTTLTTTQQKTPVILPSELTIKTGEVSDLYVLNCDDTDSITWISSNKNVASVENGTVAGISEGTVIIYAVVNNVYCECTVIVEPVEELLYGDANNNGYVEVADAVFILQGIADPSNADFTMTETGRKQANCNNPSSTGVDSQDALDIMLFKADIIETLN